MGVARALTFTGFSKESACRPQEMPGGWWGGCQQPAGNTILTVTVSPPDPGSTVHRLRPQLFRGQVWSFLVPLRAYDLA